MFYCILYYLIIASFILFPCDCNEGVLGCRGIYIYIYISSNVSLCTRIEWLASRFGRFVPEKEPGHSLNRRLVGPRAGFDVSRRHNFFYTDQDIILGSSCPLEANEYNFMKIQL
jgi:hypothetical protein